MRSRRLLVVPLLLLPLLACGKKVPPYHPAEGTNRIDDARVATLVSLYESADEGTLGQAMNETDYDKRAAAARVILRRQQIAPSSDGIGPIRLAYLSSNDPARQNYGFWLLGCIAAQGEAGEEIERLVLDWLEAHPQDPVADQALWALGETGRSEALEQFFRIAKEVDKYGPKARERSFCCASQCGRYSAATRFESIPRILEIAREKKGHAETEAWCLQALRDMAPAAGPTTLPEWEKWWEAQKKLRGA